MVEGNSASVIGINVVGLKRGGFNAEKRKAIKQAYRAIYKSGLNIGRAVEELKKANMESEEVGKIVTFFETSARGVIDHR